MVSRAAPRWKAPHGRLRQVLILSVATLLLLGFTPIFHVLHHITFHSGSLIAPVAPGTQTLPATTTGGRARARDAKQKSPPVREVPRRPDRYPPSQCVDEMLLEGVLPYWLGVTSTRSAVYQSVNGRTLTVPSLTDTLAEIRTRAQRRLNESDVVDLLRPLHISPALLDQQVKREINHANFLASVKAQLLLVKSRWGDNELHDYTHQPFVIELEPVETITEALEISFPIFDSSDPSDESNTYPSMIVVPSLSAPAMKAVDRSVTAPMPPLVQALQSQQSTNSQSLFGASISARDMPFITTTIQPDIEYTASDRQHFCALMVTPHYPELRRKPEEIPLKWWDWGYGPDSFLVNFHTVSAASNASALLNSNTISATSNASALPSLNTKNNERDRWRHLTVSDSSDPRLARLLKFLPVLQPDEPFSVIHPLSTQSLPFLFRQSGWDVSAMQPFNVSITLESEVTVMVPLDNGMNVRVRMTVMVRVTQPVIPAITLNLGASLYIADVPLPPLRSAVSTSLTLGFEGFQEFRNWEWMPEVHWDWKQPTVTPIKFLQTYRIKLSPSAGSDSRALTASLPLCQSTEHIGFYADNQSPFAAGRHFATIDPSMAPLLHDVYNQTYLVEQCDYHYYQPSEYMQCLNERFPIIHWYGDSNSRRALRQLLSGGEWGKRHQSMRHTGQYRVSAILEQRYSPAVPAWKREILDRWASSMSSNAEEKDLECEDQPDFAVAGSLGFEGVTQYPYPLSGKTENVCFFYGRHHQLTDTSYIRLPSRWGEPFEYDCQPPNHSPSPSRDPPTTGKGVGGSGDSDNSSGGSQIYYRFFPGIGHNLDFWHEYVNWWTAVNEDIREWPAPSLIVLALTNWESHTKAWDWTTHHGYDTRIGTADYHQHSNLTHQIGLLAQVFYDGYVKRNPSIRIVVRNGQVWRTPLDKTSRHHTTQRLDAYSHRIWRELKSSIIGPNIELWNVQALKSYAAMDMEVAGKSGAMCDNAHATVTQVELENQLLYNLACNRYQVRQANGTDDHKWQ